MLDVLLRRSLCVTSALEELSLRIAGEGARVTRKAPQLPVGFLIAFERLVVSEVATVYVRTYAWVRLVKMWGPSELIITEGSSQSICISLQWV